MTGTRVGGATHARNGALLVKASNPESIGLVDGHADSEVEVGRADELSPPRRRCLKWSFGRQELILPLAGGGSSDQVS